MFFKAVCSLLLMLFLAVPAMASDSLMTITDFSRRVFVNLNFADTTLGTVNCDTADARKAARQAVRMVGSKIAMPKSKSLTMANGTKTYLVDLHLIQLDAALMKKGNFVYPLKVVKDYEKFAESYETMLNPSDSIVTYAVRHGDSVEFFPVPRSTMTIEVKYWARGKNTQAAADTVDLPEETYDAVEFLATWMCAAKIRDDARAATFKELYSIEENYLRGLTDDKGKMK